MITRENEVAREMTEAASSRSAPVIPHADVTDFAQLSFDAQPSPTSKTLMTRSSQLVTNAIHYAPLPENEDPDACPNLRVAAPWRPNSHDVFTSGDLSAEITNVQDEVALCRQRTASYPNEVQGTCAAMGRHERSRSELAAGFVAEKNTVDRDWRRGLEWLDRRRDVSFAEHDRLHKSCIGRSTDSRRASSAAAPEKQPPQHDSPYFESWRQRGTLRA